MPEYGLLIDYEYCTGYHTCEVACKKVLQLPVGKYGINLNQVLMEVSPGKWFNVYIPIPTDLCNLCEERVKKGETPSCVKHCQAAAMKFGKIDELAEIYD
jgi:Fe-S-cluster-containing dehydrogenase component